MSQTQQQQQQQPQQTQQSKTVYRYEGDAKEYKSRTGARPVFQIQRTGPHSIGGGSSMSMRQSYSSMGGGAFGMAPPGAYQNISSLGTSSMKSNRQKEKKDMQDLNERLASYIEKVRFLEAQNRQLVQQLDDLKSKWGKETAAVKQMYETELATTRDLLNDAEQEKVKYELKIAPLQDEIDDLKARLQESQSDLTEEKENNRRLEQQLSDYESELQVLRRRMASLEKERERDKATIKRLTDELAACRQDLDQQTLATCNAENARQALEEELEFMKHVHEQELKELAALAYRDTTAENREYWKSELAQAVRDIQTEYDSKVEGLRGEMESFYQSKLQEFRAGAARNTMESTHTKEDVKKLRGQINDLRNRLAEGDAKIALLEKQLQDVQRERDENQRDWDIDRQGLQDEINRLQTEMEMMIAQMQDLCDAKLSLELEIAAYGKLLEGEETRIGLRSVVESVIGGDFGGMKGEMSAKTTYQRSAKGTVSLSECSADGKLVIIENTGTKDETLDGWKIVRKIDGKNTVSCTVPTFTVTPTQKKMKIWSKGHKPAGSSDLEVQVPSWGVGANIQTSLQNASGDERATHTQKTTYSS